MIFDPSDRTALRDIDVSESTLGAEERRSLDDDGFLVIPAVLPPTQVSELVRRLDEAINRLGPSAMASEPGVERFPTPVLDDEVLGACWRRPVAVAVAAHVLRAPFRTRGTTARNPLPGGGAQGIHQDAPSPVGQFLGVNSPGASTSSPMRTAARSCDLELGTAM